MVRAQSPLEFSAHEHSTTTTPNTLSEAGADVKSPGDGFVYSVATINVETTDTAIATYSSALIKALESGLVPFTATGPGASPKQVVLLQKSVSTLGTTRGDIVQQAFFYGITPGSPEEPPATNARAISVYPGATAEETRVVISGETYEKEIPFSQVVGGWTQASAAHPSGFVAVYDGDFNLLWTHQFFGADQHDCAITDVSIKVEGTAPNQIDVVTYCGISSYGMTTGWLAPNQAFVLGPNATAVCGNPGGAVSNGAGQWDGVVGRLSRSHSSVQSGLSVVPEFHSIVGGVDQDGLFGIAEMEDQRFAVVGGSAHSSHTRSGTGAEPFPFTRGTCLVGQSAYCVGAVLVFDARPTRLASPTSLLLESSWQLGGVGAGINSLARDVLIQHPFQPQSPSLDQIYVVGSTNDARQGPTGNPSFFGDLNVTVGLQTAISGTEGFVLSALSLEGSGMPFMTDGTFVGGPGDDGLTGIAGWKEFPDHLGLLGFRPEPHGPTSALSADLTVTSLFCDTTSQSLPGSITSGPLQSQEGPNPLSTGLVPSRTIGGSGTEVPAAMGDIIATQTQHGLVYDDCGLGSPAGGGICMDQQGRINVVGSTTTGTGTGFVLYPTVASTRTGFQGQDAVRTVLDMLPPRVSRTDGTGTRTAAVTPAPVPVAGVDGGTTPVSALSPFGVQLGAPAPALKRMLIDYQGPNPGNNVTAWLLLDRPPLDTAVLSTFWQFGFPLPQPNTVLIPGIEFWLTGIQNTSFVTQIASSGSWLGSARFQMGPMPAAPTGGFVFTVQAFCLLTSPLPGGFMTAASPALSFDY